MEDRRSWRPLPATHDAVPQLVVSATFGTAWYAVRVSDLVHIWSETLSRREICMRGFREDTPIDPSYDAEQMAVFLDKLRAALEPGHAEHGSTSLSLSLATDDKGSGGSEQTCGPNLVLHATVELPGGLRPLRWPICLARQPPAAVASDLVLPLLRDRRERARDAAAVAACLRDKDAVIAKLVDKLEALGAGLGSVFPSLAGRHHPLQKQQMPNQLTRTAMGERVPGLAPFSLERYRKKQAVPGSGGGGEESCSGDRALVLEALGDGDDRGGELACEAAVPSDPSLDLDGWWQSIGRGPGLSLRPTPTAKTEAAVVPTVNILSSSPAAATAVDNDDYVYRATPKKNRAIAAEPASSSPTPKVESPPSPTPPPPKQAGKAGKLGRLGAIGKKKATTPPPPPPPEPEAAAVTSPPPPAGEADESDTASEAGDAAQLPAKPDDEAEEQRPPTSSAAEVSVRPKSSSGSRGLGRIGKDKKTAATAAAAAAEAVAEEAPVTKKGEDEMRQKERIQQAVGKHAAPVRKKRKF